MGVAQKFWGEERRLGFWMQLKVVYVNCYSNAPQKKSRDSSFAPHDKQHGTVNFCSSLSAEEERKSLL